MRSILIPIIPISTFALLSLPSIVFAATSTATCYYPNGKVSQNDVPCSDNQYTSCCGETATCLTNGLCFTQLTDNHLARGSCTDQSWGSNCTQICHGSSDNPSGSIPIITHSRNSTVSTWCCGMPEISKDGNSLVCPNSESAFELDVGSIIVGRAALANATISSSSGSSDTSATSTLSSSSSSSGSSSSKETAIGVGVGVPLGVVALASLAWAIWERKNRLAISKKLDNEKQYLMQGRYVDGTGNNANAIPKAQPQPMPELEAHVVSEMDSRPKPSAE